MNVIMTHKTQNNGGCPHYPHYPYERTRQFQATTRSARATSFVLKIGSSLVQQTHQ